jgi:hypothetical protein
MGIVALVEYTIRTLQESRGVAEDDRMTIVTSNKTMEGMIESVRKEPGRSQMLVAEELSSLLTGLDQYKGGGKGSDRSTLLSLKDSMFVAAAVKGERGVNLATGSYKLAMVGAAPSTRAPHAGQHLAHARARAPRAPRTFTHATHVHARHARHARPQTRKLTHAPALRQAGTIQFGPYGKHVMSQAGDGLAQRLPATGFPATLHTLADSAVDDAQQRESLPQCSGEMMITWRGVARDMQRCAPFQKVAFYSCCSSLLQMVVADRRRSTRPSHLRRNSTPVDGALALALAPQQRRGWPWRERARGGRRRARRRRGRRAGGAAPHRVGDVGRRAYDALTGRHWGEEGSGRPRNGG